MRVMPSHGHPRSVPKCGDVESNIEINGLPSGKAIPHVVTKPWGHELWYINTEMYCSKLLAIMAGKSCSMHFHVGKHETLVVTKGVLTIEYIVNKQAYSIDLKPGEAFVIAPGLPHRLLALKGDVELVESSTQHFEEDSVKLA